MRRRTRRHVAECMMAAVTALASWTLYQHGIELADTSVRVVGAERRNPKGKGGRRGKKRY